MKVINLTPHVINVGERKFDPSGIVARVAEVSAPAGTFDGIELVTKSYGQVENLPEPQDGALFIVSAMVRLARTDRYDLASPGDHIRDDDGRIVGVWNLVINQKPIRAQLCAQGE